MIEVKGVTKWYGTFRALDQISFSLDKGEVVGFLGPNGAGKTTTMRILTGFIPPSEGECTVAGHNVSAHSLLARQKMGYLPEATPLYGDMEVTDYLKYIGALRKLSGDLLKKRLKEVVAICGLGNAVGKKISTLSKGFRQRTGLAQALLHDPEVLILDEPTVGLDPNQIVEIRNLIRQIGKSKTILLSTHILSEVEQTCTRVIIISDGKIAGQGTPQELIHKTHGAPVYFVGIRGEENVIRDGLKTLPFYKDSNKISTVNGVIHFQIALDSKNNLSEEIFKLCVAQKWGLTELRREEATLEEVFKKLTQ